MKELQTQDRFFCIIFSIFDQAKRGERKIQLGLTLASGIGKGALQSAA
jgi:hypothetical protein